MMDGITVTREQATEIFKAINGIAALLKRLPPKPENQGVMYSIMSNLAVIQTNLAGMPRANSN
jgi:hypothetical protein